MPTLQLRPLTIVSDYETYRDGNALPAPVYKSGANTIFYIAGLAALYSMRRLPR